jgi:hypothetical protein
MLPSLVDRIVRPRETWTAKVTAVYHLVTPDGPLVVEFDSYPNSIIVIGDEHGEKLEPFPLQVGKTYFISAIWSGDDDHLRYFLEVVNEIK